MNLDLKAKLANNGKPNRILALDGGGIRGALTLGYLEKLETLLRERSGNQNLKLCDYFDLIGGTSTGAIIASCLATGMDVKTVIGLYEEFGKEILESGGLILFRAAGPHFGHSLKHH